MAIVLSESNKRRRDRLSLIVSFAAVGAGLGWWWATLRQADQPAWAGAIGSLVSGFGAFAAAAAAVWIADRDRRIRIQDRGELARVATAFVYMDMQQIAVFGCALHSSLLELSRIESGMPYAGPITNIKTCTGRVKEMSERTSLERINALPPEVGIDLCGAVGGFPFACDAIEQTIFNLELMVKPLEGARSDLVQHALTLSIPLRGLIKYFEWFGEAFPEDKKEAADATIAAINKQISADSYNVH